jgi:hypothetical protein
MYKTDYYGRVNINSNGKYVIEEIKAHIYDVIPLKGKATVTHAGGNGRFAFELDGNTYYTEFQKSICTDRLNHGVYKETDQYYLYSELEFNIDIINKWFAYYKESKDYDDSNVYWKSINVLV